MKKNQFLLLKLIEECAEVAHVAAKQIQFGKDSTNRSKFTLTNAEHLKNELLDLAVIWKLLEESEETPQFTSEEADVAYEIKKAKMQKYLNASASLGELPEILL